MTDWELRLTAGMLGGVVIVTPRDMELLKRLEREAPRLHAHLIDWLLGWEICDVQVELTGLMWKLENWWSRPAWGATRQRFRHLPDWFKSAYSGF